MFEIPARLNLAAHVLDARVAEGRGARVAIRFDDAGPGAGRWGAVTYAELLDESNRVANVLAGLGVGRGDRVLVALPDGPPFAAAFFGALKVGAAVAMANPELPAADYAAHLAYTRAKVLFVDAGLAARAAAPIAEARELVAALVVGGGGETARSLAYGARVAAASTGFVNADTAADDPAVWIATSGSTGSPRAAVHGHRSFAFSIEAYAKGVLGLGAGDVTLSVPKLYFGYATGMSLLFPLAVGATAVLYPDRPTPERMFELVARHRPTVLALVPTLIAKMVAAAPRPEVARAFAGARLATSAGEALPVPLYARWRERFGVEIVEGLGSAELFHIHLSNRAGDVRPGTLGRVVPGYEARVVRDDGSDAPDGEIGARWVRGGSAALRYEGDPERTAQVFGRADGGWVATSDKVRRAGGVFTFEGRSDDMLKVGGIYVSPLEVENVLLQHPAVSECAVVAYEDEAGLVKPKAVVVVRGGDAADPDTDTLWGELDAFARARLAAFKVPRRWERLPALPRNDRGKLVRRTLRESGQTGDTGSSR
ncbi:MAG TPA: benzoate-CoA ligase family protein [Polyangia bacterium]|nr:benzoate-CoA ligase family protein [Polyangia bacterium]